MIDRTRGPGSFLILVLLAMASAAGPSAAQDSEGVRDVVERLVRSRGFDGTSPEADELRLPGLAAERGVTPAALRRDVSRWVDGATGPSDRGLAALYQERYAAARRELSEASDAGATPVRDRLYLARAQLALGDTPGTLATVASALEIDPGNLRATIDYGSASLRAGLFAQADTLLQRASRQADGEGATDEAVAAHMELAAVLAAQARFGEAERQLERAITSARAGWNPEDRSVALLHLVRGQIRHAQGNLDEAMEAYAAVDEALAGMDGDAVPQTRVELQVSRASAVLGLGLVDSAGRLLAEATGGDSLARSGAAGVARTLALGHLASAYYTTGHADRAETALLAAREEMYARGDSLHPAADEAVARLAAFYAAEGRLDEAEGIYRAQLERRRSSLCGVSSPTRGTAGAAPSGRPPLARAAPAGDPEPAPAAATARCDVQHPGLAQARNGLGVVLESSGEREEADLLYHQALAGLQQSVGDDHPNAVLVKESLARNGEKVILGGTGWEISPSIGQLNDFPTEWNPDPVEDQLRRDALQALRGGYTWPSRFFLQGEAVNGLLVVRNAAGARRNLNVFTLGVAGGYNVRLLRMLEVFPVLGAGYSLLNPDGAEGEWSFQLNAGVGARVFFTPKIAVRGDLRIHRIRDPLQVFRASPEAVAPVEDLYLGELAAGISWFLGRPYDSDGDGVRNERDHCPGTPSGHSVDARGCSADSDRDQVRDFQDQCPGTPLGAVVNVAGCGIDPDHDGVPSGIDRCEGSQPGAVVGADGCPMREQD